MFTLCVAKAVCTSVHVLGRTPIARLFFKPVLASCLYLSLIAEPREKHGCCGASASLSQKGLEKGRGCGREQRQRGLATLETLVGTPGNLGRVRGDEFCEAGAGGD